jgi:hypothetical protein
VVRHCVDLTADLNDEDGTGNVWTFLDEARDPGQIKPAPRRRRRGRRRCMPGDRPGPAGNGTIVHLKMLTGLVDDYRDLVQRALPS